MLPSADAPQPVPLVSLLEVLTHVGAAVAGSVPAAAGALGFVARKSTIIRAKDAETRKREAERLAAESETVRTLALEALDRAKRAERISDACEQRDEAKALEISHMASRLSANDEVLEKAFAQLDETDKSLIAVTGAHEKCERRTLFLASEMAQLRRDLGLPPAAAKMVDP